MGKEENKPEGIPSGDPDGCLTSTPVVKESPAPYLQKQEQPSCVQGEKTGHTIDDYRTLPDDQRVELIDGQFYDMAAPTSLHQQLELILGSLFLDHIWKHGGSCQVFPAPFDVQLDQDNRTMVQPDLSVICDPGKIRNFGCFGAPDLIIEILSSSTERKDMFLKTHKYQSAGVREYWIIDPNRRRILVYYFEEDLLPAIYGFDSIIPVRIWNGELKLDFAKISPRLIHPEQ